MSSDSDDDILAGFGEDRGETAEPEMDPQGNLEMASSEQALKRASLRMYVALAAPLLASPLVAYMALGFPGNPLVLSTLVVAAMVVLWVIFKGELLDSVPQRISATRDAHYSMGKVWSLSLAGLVATSVSAAITGVAMYVQFLGLSISSSTVTMLMWETVIVSVAGFLIPSLLGFNSLVRVFRETESALESGGEQ